MRGRSTPPPTPKAAESATTPKMDKAPAPTYVQIQIDSTPHGARIVRVADNVTLGTTPQTLELRASATPMQVRLEKEGFVPDLREIALLENARFVPTLEAVPAIQTPDPLPMKKPGKGPKHTKPEIPERVEEPAKL